MSVVLPFFILYGMAVSVLFYVYVWLRRSKIAQVAHVAIFAGLSYYYLIIESESLAGGSGLGAAQGFASVFVGYMLCSAASAVAFACIGAEYAADLGRWLMSYNKIPELKTYDRAEAAVSNRDYARAARLYRKAIEDDPDDVEAYRRLAEVLMKLERPEDAAKVFRAGLKRAEKPGDRCRIAFRLAEVLHEELGRADEGAELYRMIAEEHPDDRRAEYARSRLRQMGAAPPGEQPDDSGEDT